MTVAEKMIADMLGRIEMLDAEITAIGADCHKQLSRLEQVDLELVTARRIVAQTLEEQACTQPHSSPSSTAAATSPDRETTARPTPATDAASRSFRRATATARAMPAGTSSAASATAGSGAGSHAGRPPASSRKPIPAKAC